MFQTGREEVPFNYAFRKRRKTYDGPFKAKIVCDWINGVKTLGELADLYQIHPSQIKNWKTRLLKNASLVLNDKRRRKAVTPIGSEAVLSS